jgi:hypothetical protein
LDGGSDSHSPQPYGVLTRLGSEQTARYREHRLAGSERRWARHGYTFFLADLQTRVRPIIIANLSRRARHWARSTWPGPDPFGGLVALAAQMPGGRAGPDAIRFDAGGWQPLR